MLQSSVSVPIPVLMLDAINQAQDRKEGRKEGRKDVNRFGYRWNGGPQHPKAQFE